MILKIVDFNQYVTPVEILFFRQARERFQEALSQVRENVILNNESYETDESDIFLGFFMFSIDELCEVIANFEEDPHPKNNICHYLKLSFVIFGVPLRLVRTSTATLCFTGRSRAG
ncbi:hypothetical protein AGDE_13884 [Angomonas deanei]|nr:hypothetical protein AGDE_13884 [Angomonas deanei]|eukprot:EPY21671.1 hypothetical protein AGDE_13884 [Angomonas deanei]